MPKASLTLACRIGFKAIGRPRSLAVTQTSLPPETLLLRKPAAQDHRTLSRIVYHRVSSSLEADCYRETFGSPDSRASTHSFHLSTACSSRSEVNVTPMHMVRWALHAQEIGQINTWKGLSSVSDLYSLISTS